MTIKHKRNELSCYTAPINDIPLVHQSRIMCLNSAKFLLYDADVVYYSSNAYKIVSSLFCKPPFEFLDPFLLKDLWHFDRVSAYF